MSNAPASRLPGTPPYPAASSRYERSNPAGPAAEAPSLRMKLLMVQERPAEYEVGAAREVPAEFVNPGATARGDPADDESDAARDTLRWEEPNAANANSPLWSRAPLWIQEVNRAGIRRIGGDLGVVLGDELRCDDCRTIVLLDAADQRFDCRGCGNCGNPLMIATRWFWKKEWVLGATPADWRRLRAELARRGFCSTEPVPGGQPLASAATPFVPEIVPLAS